MEYCQQYLVMSNREIEILVQHIVDCRNVYILQIYDRNKK